MWVGVHLTLTCVGVVVLLLVCLSVRLRDDCAHRVETELETALDEVLVQLVDVPVVYGLNVPVEVADGVIL